jgi:hypothetical protein
VSSRSVAGVIALRDEMMPASPAVGLQLDRPQGFDRHLLLLDGLGVL